VSAENRTQRAGWMISVASTMNSTNHDLPCNCECCLTSVHRQPLSLKQLLNFEQNRMTYVPYLTRCMERLFKFLRVIPASSATAERSFSWLRRLKTYLRAIMSQERLNHVALFHVHQNRLYNLDLAKIKSMFISANDYRQGVFGRP